MDGSDERSNNPSVALIPEPQHIGVTVPRAALPPNHVSGLAPYLLRPFPRRSARHGSGEVVWVERSEIPDIRSGLGRRRLVPMDVIWNPAGTWIVREMLMTYSNGVADESATLWQLLM